MICTERQNMLIVFVKQQFDGIQRKYTKEPYFNHCYETAEIVSHLNDLYMEKALCHDLFEETFCTYVKLKIYLQTVGYSKKEAIEICDCTKDLTDLYTKKAFPKKNRLERKALETIRLSKINPKSQTVKYADIINNIKNIVVYDRDFAPTYLGEKRVLLLEVKEGDSDLRLVAIQLVVDQLTLLLT